MLIHLTLSIEEIQLIFKGKDNEYKLRFSQFWSIFMKNVQKLFVKHQQNLIMQEAEKHAGHSTLLADKPDLFEMLVDDVKPEKWDEYLKHKSEYHSGL